MPYTVYLLCDLIFKLYCVWKYTDYAQYCHKPDANKRDKASISSSKGLTSVICMSFSKGTVNIECLRPWLEMLRVTSAGGPDIPHLQLLHLSRLPKSCSAQVCRTVFEACMVCHNPWNRGWNEFFSPQRSTPAFLVGSPKSLI